MNADRQDALAYWLTRRPIFLQWALRCRGRLTAELSVMLERVSPEYVVFDVALTGGTLPSSIRSSSGDTGECMRLNLSRRPSACSKSAWLSGR